MNKERFTPAPWCIHEDKDGIIVTDKVGDRICAVDTPMGIDESEQDNAALISAAPEMYRCLRMFLDLPGADTPEFLSKYLHTTLEAINVIQKARGEK